MTEIKRTYLVDEEGVHAYVPAADVDTYKPLGWAEVKTEPLDTDLVWLEHAESGGKQKFAHAVAPQWEALGWSRSAPPPPVDLLHDHTLVDPEVAVTQPKSKSTKAASGGPSKEQ
jgi:hypothetical protein